MFKNVTQVIAPNSISLEDFFSQMSFYKNVEIIGHYCAHWVTVYQVTVNGEKLDLYSGINNQHLKTYSIILKSDNNCDNSNAYYLIDNLRKSFNCEFIEASFKEIVPNLQTP